MQCVELRIIPKPNERTLKSPRPIFWLYESNERIWNLGRRTEERTCLLRWWRLDIAACWWYRGLQVNIMQYNVYQWRTSGVVYQETSDYSFINNRSIVYSSVPRRENSCVAWLPDRRSTRKKYVMNVGLPMYCDNDGAVRLMHITMNSTKEQHTFN